MTNSFLDISELDSGTLRAILDHSVELKAVSGTSAAPRPLTGKTLAMIPLLVSIALLAVFASPVLAVIIAAWVTLKAGNYSITRPGREMLYTNVTREDRFKTKQVIDIVVYRGGDVFSGFIFASLTTTLGLGLGPIALIGAGVALAWAYVGLRLGTTYDRES